MIADNYAPQKTLGNGVTTSFSFGWAIISADNLRVYLEDKDTGVQTLVSSGITVTFNDATPGGTVVFDTAPTAQNYVVRAREIPQANTVALKTASGFQGAVVEALFDKVVAMVQDAYEATVRSVRLPLGSTADATIPNPQAGKAIIGNDENDGFTSSSVNIEDLADDVANVAQSVTDAQTAQAAAELAETNAEAAAASVPNIVRGTFVNADLTTGKLTVTHNKSLSAPYSCWVEVINGSAQKIIPDQITFATNSFEIDLTSYGVIVGTYGYTYMA